MFHILCLLAVVVYTYTRLLSGQSAVHLSGFSASGQFAAAELILLVTTKPLQRRPDRTLPAPPEVGRRTPESRPCYKVSLLFVLAILPVEE